MKRNHTILLVSRHLNRVLTLVCLSLFLLAAGGQALAQGQKYALLIGIGNYPSEGGWQHINATNDLVVIGDALKKRGFPEGNIFLLKDQDATREGILKAWRQGLLPHVHTGDVVYFQFSGHGQQVADDNGDELDGYDEAIVPFDSPLHYVEGVYEGKNLIRDDELNTLFTDLRRRLGPNGNLMVVLDACHSGTGTRGMEPARGTDIPMASDDYARKVANRPGEPLSAAQFGVDGVKGLAPMVAFFGSAQNQLNFEARDEQGQLLGSLSYALSKKLSQAPPTTTYRGLFEQIRVEMSAIAPRQQPQAEGGNALDQELMGGRLLPRPMFYHVTAWNDPGSVIIDAGWVQGLNDGAIIGLFPPETRDPEHSTPLARGTVNGVRPFEATLQLDQNLSQEDAQKTWAYVLEQNFGTLRIGLSIQLPDSHPLKKALLDRIARYPMIRLDDAPELFLTTSGTEVKLIGHGDAELQLPNLNLNQPAVAAEQVLRQILAYAQAKYLRQMEARSPVLNVDFELIPVQVDPRTLMETGDIPIDTKRDATGNLHFKDGDYFKVRVTNRGEKAAYFTLLDIQPDNVVNPLIPDENETPSEFRVLPGQSVNVPKLFHIGPPSGVEMFKLIATEQPVDLRPIATSRGAGTRSNTPLNPLEKLFGQTFFNDDCLSRGGKTVNLSANSINVQTSTFIID